MIGAITFEPLLMERVWGGRELERLYGRRLPGVNPIGESWELVDREKEQSVVWNGPLAGRTLHDLWTAERVSVFGERFQAHPAERFPVLVKILDARDTLSLQVHPPAGVVPAPGAEPKTEMWVVAEAAADAALHAGLKRGVTRAAFERALAEGTAADVVHRLPVTAGDFLFLPSGRVHAIGAGLVIFEIQQNSDTTYRVFDWNRLGLDGCPRELHVAESMQCIDFDDFEPALGRAEGTQLAACAYFRTDRHVIAPGEKTTTGPAGESVFIGVISGRVQAGGRDFTPGEFFLLPAADTVGARRGPEVASSGGATILAISLP